MSTSALLRGADWHAILAHDPALKQDPQTAALLPLSGGLYVTYRAPGLEISGYPDLHDLSYGDLRGDGVEEAVIPLNSGGTTGDTGFLIYAPSPAGPHIIAAQQGYKLSVAVKANQLVVTSPVYAGWEPNCCPSSTREVRYRLSGTKLVEAGSRQTPVPGADTLTVAHFYDLINARKFSEAYAFLSPAFQQRQPYSAWQAGYQQTQQVVAHVAPAAPGSVTVNLAATNQSPGGGTQVKHYSGTWYLVFSDQRNQWLLDRADIEETP